MKFFSNLFYYKFCNKISCMGLILLIIIGITYINISTANYTILDINAEEKLNNSQDKEPHGNLNNFNLELEFSHAEKLFFSKDYKGALAKFETINDKNPFSKNHEQILYYCSLCSLKIKNYDKSIKYSDYYLLFYKNGKFLEDIYYIRGKSKINLNKNFIEKIINIDFSKRDLTKSKEALNDFYTIVEKFKKGKYYAKSLNYISYIEKLIIKHELSVAKFYYNKGKKIAALNRLNELISKYSNLYNYKEEILYLRDIINEKN